MDKQVRKFIITYTHYYDCPVCDGHGSHETESIHQEQVNELEGIKAYVKAGINTSKFLMLYEVLPYGVISPVSCFNEHYGFHRIGRVDFDFNGDVQVLRCVDNFNYEWMTSTEKVLYE
jgi:hypothetical protein